MTQKKSTYLLLIFSMGIFLLTNLLTAGEATKYSQVKIHFQSQDQLQELAQKGLPLDDGFYQREADGFSVTAVFNEKEMHLLKNSSVFFDTLVDDVIANFNARKKMTPREMRKLQTTSGLTGFKFGSMAGFLTFDEVVSELDSMHLKYPNLITARDSIGTTIENRAIWAVKISDNPDVEEDEPEVLYTALHHVREPESIMAVVYYMYYLLENYGIDPEVTYLVNNRELYFIPVVNPDGYVYNQTTHPSGGGMWRKNRRANSDGTFGVDLNRNYGYMWGYNDIGSSPDPSSNVYRGTAPFSEPETQAIRDFCIDHHFILTLNYHTYSNLLIYPWGYIGSFPTPDSTVYEEYASDMTQYNHYVYGTGDQTVGYLVNGDSDDWMYGEQAQKNKILAMTPEVGGPSDGFWPPQSRILPLAQENVYPNLFVAWAAGGLVKAVDFSIFGDDDQNGYFDPGESGKVVFTIKNIGQGDASNVTLRLSSPNSFVTVNQSEETPPIQLASRESVESDTFTFSIASDAPQAHALELILQTKTDGIARLDTLRNTLIGTPVLLFADSLEQGISNWIKVSGWDITSASFRSPSHSFTDSPDGDYSSYCNRTLLLDKSFDLSDAVLDAYLQFWTKWSIEPEWDFAQVLVSTDSLHWHPFSGLYTKNGSGSGVQTANEPGYDGFQSHWVQEKISLRDYIGQPKVFVKFNLQSDSYVEYDGWYIDDISLLVYQGQSSGISNAEIKPIKFSLRQNYPNPFNPTTAINYALPEATQVKLIVYNALGQKIKTLDDEYQTSGTKTARWDGRNETGNIVSSGIYFFKITVGNKNVRFEKVIKGILMK